MDKAQITKGYTWLCKTIDSCSNLLQLETTERIIETMKRKSTDPSWFDAIDRMFQSKATEMNYYKWKKLDT